MVVSLSPQNFKIPEGFAHRSIQERLVRTDKALSGREESVFPKARPFIRSYTGAKKYLIPQLMCLLPPQMPELPGFGSGFLGSGAFELSLIGQSFWREGIPTVWIEANPLAVAWQQFQLHSAGTIWKALKRVVYETEKELGRKERRADFRFTKEEYEAVKRRYNREKDQLDLLTMAHLLIYLANASFYGAFRFNSRGGFNGQYGNKSPDTQIFSYPEFKALCSSLTGIDIRRGDYRSLFEAGLPAGSFIYLDPPYYATYDGYTQEGFALFAFPDFMKFVIELQKRDYQVMVSQSFHPAVRRAFNDRPGFNCAVVYRYNAQKKLVPEYVFRNYSNGTSEEQLFLAERVKLEGFYALLEEAINEGKDPAAMVEQAVELNGLSAATSDTP